MSSSSQQNQSLLIKVFPNLKYLFIDSGKVRDLQYWRERIVDSIYLIFTFFGLIAYIPSVYMAAVSDYWFIVLVDTAVYGSFLGIYFSNNISFFFKTSFILIATYLIGLSLLLMINADYSLMWFFSVPVIAAVLLGLKAAIVTLIINFIIMCLTGYFIHTGIVSWNIVADDLLSGWFILSINFMFLNFVTSISISILFEQLRNTLDKAILANTILDEEHKKLVHEIQQRIKAEEEKEIINKKLQQLQKIEAVGMIAGGVAHDLNNILSGIINYPELMLRKLPEDSELRKPLTAIMKSGIRAAEVVSDLLTVARGVASAKHPYNLNTIVDEYLESHEFAALKSRYPDITISSKLDENVQNICCSRIHIFKSLMNLVTNSAESIGDHGHISISTSSNVIQADADNPSQTHGRFSILEVCDSGKGIAQRDLNRIFEPFYTRKNMGRSGTGLGLTIVWNTVQDHEGDITVSSDVSSGTCFHLSFPVSSDDLQETVSTYSSDDLEGSGETILLVDDEEAQREIASDILQSLNYKVITADSGNAAIEYLNSSSADLIILDMIMPPGMNGLETYKEIIKTRPEQKTVIASGFSANRDVKAAQNAGAGEFLAKPYTRIQLALVIKKALNLSG